MEDIKFTIIIPAYNVESYIETCLNSVIQQSYSNFEIILVNDGSTDNTGHICDGYSMIDNRIKVIHKKNGGLSDARNEGLKNVEGDYIIFIDSDDYIDINALKIFNEKLKQRPDILITKLVQHYEGNVSIEMDLKMDKELNGKIDKHKAIDWVFNKSENTWPAPKYIVSSRIIKDNSIKFRMGFLHEDIDWTMNIFYHANTFSSASIPWYYHRMGRIGSITSTGNFKRATDIIQMASIHINDKKYNSVDEGIRKIMFNRLIRSVYAILSQYKLANEEGRNEIARCLSNNKKILKYAPCFRHKIFVIASRLLGEKNALNLMAIIH